METILLGNDYTIDVESGATIIKKTGASYVPIDLSNIQPGNEVTVFGLTNCKAPNKFLRLYRGGGRLNRIYFIEGYRVISSEAG